MMNDISIFAWCFFFFFFSLTTKGIREAEEEKKKKKEEAERRNKLSFRPCFFFSHFYSQWQSNCALSLSLSFCRLVFSSSSSFLLSSKLSRLTIYISDTFSCWLRKKRNRAEKNRKRSVVIDILVVSPSFLISRVNFYCMEVKEKKTRKREKRTMLSKKSMDKSMDSKDLSFAVKKARKKERKKEK